MTLLSEFQTACEREVHNVLHAFGRQLVGRRIGQVSGSRDPDFFVSGTISGTETEVFVYDDGAELLGGKGVDVRMERPDFDTLDELKNAYVAALSKYLRESTKSPP